jgi:hypothetical protein
MEIDCLKCGAKLSGPVAGISTCPRGDEEIFSYFLCSTCDVWTVDFYLDRFMGDTFVKSMGPYARAVGDEAVAKIRQCPTPHDKMCGCPIHQAWRG